ncbi:hypothetical protein DFR29_112184 [Tahibacter aquaticus]|uniref:Integral membrane protein n=1 Tax=Tahibacter aquaticus TaxID=520092 RepID=A0A4V3DLT0_9GAMM|nr:hypothetical protein [Tahibacter aquaticus]TDR40870.1 hypothetical protein DFR29_112184 [Tahibacter aquaticus]
MPRPRPALPLAGLLPALCLCLAGLPAALAAAEPVPQIAGLLRDTRLDEVSGMASSQRTPGRLWLHNDSGTRAELFAVDASGRVQARLTLPGIKPVDWEDLASFTLDGKAYLLIADTGDNGGVRRRSELIVLEEPAFDAGKQELSLQAQPAWRIAFRYADEPHDVEAVGVDAQAGRVLLLTKRTSPPQIWSLPLKPADTREQVAELAGTLAVPNENTPSVDFHRRLQPGRPTGMAIAADGHSALVLTYASAWLFQRNDGESWPQALARLPRVFPIGLVGQAEAVSIAGDGRSGLITGERWPAPLIRIEW